MEECQDLIAQLVIVIDLWNQGSNFPVEFQPMYMGSQVQDQTNTHIEELNQTCTKMIWTVMDVVGNKNSKSIDESLRKLITTLGARGIYTMLGLRKTVGSS